MLWIFKDRAKFFIKVLSHAQFLLLRKMKASLHNRLPTSSPLTSRSRTIRLKSPYLAREPMLQVHR